MLFFNGWSVWYEAAEVTHTNLKMLNMKIKCNVFVALKQLLTDEFSNFADVLKQL